jgi:hypothetical protein
VKESRVDVDQVVAIAILIVVLYVAFRIGALILRIVLGLLAIAVVVYLVQSLFGATP